MDEERERLSMLKSDRIIQLENALKSVLAHFGVSSIAWSVIYDGGLSVEDLRALVVAAGDVAGFPETPPNQRLHSTGTHGATDNQSRDTRASG